MIYPAINQEEWTKKYSLTAKDYVCPSCKRTFKTTVPVITNECAGLASPIHECGRGYVRYVLTPRKSEVEDFWRTVLS
jgi:transposase-like protein